MMSPDLGPLLGNTHSSLESVEALTHDVADESFQRVWRFQARTPLKILSGYNITREMMTWDEHSTYQHDSHTARWHVIPRGEDAPDALWRRHFNAEGSYHLEALKNGRTRRTIRGEMEIHLKMIGRMVERIAVAKLRKAYDAEADALRTLHTLP